MNSKTLSMIDRSVDEDERSRESQWTDAWPTKRLRCMIKVDMKHSIWLISLTWKLDTDFRRFNTPSKDWTQRFIWHVWRSFFLLRLLSAIHTHYLMAILFSDKAENFPRGPEEGRWIPISDKVVENTLLGLVKEELFWGDTTIRSSLIHSNRSRVGLEYALVYMPPSKVLL